MRWPHNAKSPCWWEVCAKNRFTRKTANALIALAPPNLKPAIVEIGQLPLYNQDLDTSSPPAEWAAFRDRVRPVQGVLFVTPEYNRSVPGLLKNAIDVGSRPYGKSVWDKKPAGIVSVSPGALGAFGANHHLRQSLVFLNMPAMQMPEAYVGGADKLFDAARQTDQRFHARIPLQIHAGLCRLGRETRALIKLKLKQNVSFPAERRRRDGKGTHQARVCAPKNLFAPQTRRGSVPLPSHRSRDALRR